MKSIQMVVTAAVAATLLSACGSGTSDDSTSGAGKTSAEVIAEAKELTDANLAGTDRELPTDGPTAQKGKSVWVLACSTVAPGCSLPAAGFAEAGKALGWDVKVVDGKVDPSVFNAQVRAAVSAKADAVVMAGVDCPLVKGSIEAAQKAGTKVFVMTGIECDDEYATGGDKPLFDGFLPWESKLTDYATYLDTYVGPGMANWVIAKTNGKANVILMKEDDTLTTRHIGESTAERLADCAGCKVTTVEFTAADLFTGKMQAKASSALQKNPDADVIMVPIDAAITLGVGAAADQARAGGRELLLVGMEGSPAAIKLLESGTQSFALGRPMFWVGWAGADALNRMFAGEEPVDSGIGLGSMDGDHLPGVEVYDGNDPSVPYKANYKRIWGVS